MPVPDIKVIIMILAGAYSEPSQRSKMDGFVQVINGFQPFNVFQKRSILGIRQGSEFAIDWPYGLLVTYNFVADLQHKKMPNFLESLDQQRRISPGKIQTFTT